MPIRFVGLENEERKAIIDALTNEALMARDACDSDTNEEDYVANLEHSDWLRELASKVLMMD